MPASFPGLPTGHAGVRDNKHCPLHEKLYLGHYRYIRTAHQAFIQLPVRVLFICLGFIVNTVKYLRGENKNNPLVLISETKSTHAQTRGWKELQRNQWKLNCLNPSLALPGKDHCDSCKFGEAFHAKRRYGLK